MGTPRTELRKWQKYINKKEAPKYGTEGELLDQKLVAFLNIEMKINMKLKSSFMYSWGKLPDIWFLNASRCIPGYMLQVH